MCRHIDLVPNISKDRTGILILFVNLMTTSFAPVFSADAQRSALDSASVYGLGVISLLERERIW